MTWLARLKSACIEAVEQAGGKEGAGATAERSSSTAANWRNRSAPDFPPLDCAYRLDNAALIDGRRPALLQRYAAELGHVAIRLPEGIEGEDAETGALAKAIAEFGDIGRSLMDGRADGVLSPQEREATANEIDQAIEALVMMKAIVLPNSVRATDEFDEARH